jgi:hypothetical protein
VVDAGAAGMLWHDHSDTDTASMLWHDHTLFPHNASTLEAEQQQLLVSSALAEQPAQLLSSARSSLRTHVWTEDASQEATRPEKTRSGARARSTQSQDRGVDVEVQLEQDLELETGELEQQQAHGEAKEPPAVVIRDEQFGVEDEESGDAYAAEDCDDRASDGRDLKGEAHTVISPALPAALAAGTSQPHQYDADATLVSVISMSTPVALTAAKAPITSAGEHGGGSNVDAAAAAASGIGGDEMAELQRRFEQRRIRFRDHSSQVAP